jgi:DMSO/TMAO reductase YedYZ molybdopterin-dependent catalytic subunit
VLGLLGLAGLGIALGPRANSALSAVAANDPTGLTGLIPGGGRFRFYSVAGPVADIPPSEYRLRVDGEVQRPREFTYADLAAMPQTRLTADVQCVTGWRVPDVEWGGVLLSDLLAEVRPRSTAAALEFGSADGIYTESLTLDQATRPDVLVATHMQGAPIVNDHGGPVRLFVAPMYFYKSLKWLDRITLGTDVDPGYWEDLGYDVDAWVGRSNGRDDAPTV